MDQGSPSQILRRATHGPQPDRDSGAQDRHSISPQSRAHSAIQNSGEDTDQELQDERPGSRLPLDFDPYAYMEGYEPTALRWDPDHEESPDADDDKEKVPVTGVSADGTGWTHIYGQLERLDREMIRGYSEDIDSLLIFAGLFSAVLTAFLVELYKQLQPDQNQLTLQILSDISQQLSEMSQGNATSPSDALKQPFHDPTHVVAINTLWFLSLVLALGSALVGIIVKQWLREYIVWPTVSPVQHALQLRRFRFDAFKKWRIPTIVTLVPILLQVAVVLFLGGLITLTWTLNRAVFVVATVAVAVTVLAAILAVVLPLLYDACPYKTPFGWMLLSLLRPLYISSHRFATSARRRLRKIHPLFSSSASHTTYFDVDVLPPPSSSHEDKGIFPDLFQFNDWVHRDFALRGFGRDPITSTANQCLTLLRYTAQGELDKDTIEECLHRLPGPRIRTHAAINDSGAPMLWHPDGWPGDPMKFLFASWIAISEALGFPDDPSLPLLISIEEIWFRPYGKDYEALTLERYGRCLDSLRPALQAVNDNQLRLMHRLLEIGIEGMFKDSAIRYIYDVFETSSTPELSKLLITLLKHSPYMTVNSLWMMRLLSEFVGEIVPPRYVLFVLRALSTENFNFLFDTMIGHIKPVLLPGHEVVYRCLTIRPWYLRHPIISGPKDFHQALQIVTSIGEPKKLGEVSTQRHVFWAAVSILINVWLKGDPWGAPLGSAMSAFFDVLSSALTVEIRRSLDPEPQRYAHTNINDEGKNGPADIDFRVLIHFIRAHKRMSPDRSAAVIRRILEGHHRGWERERIELAFKEISDGYPMWGDPRWAFTNMAHVYEYFRFDPTAPASWQEPHSGDVAMPSPSPLPATSSQRVPDEAVLPNDDRPSASSTRSPYRVAIPSPLPASAPRLDGTAVAYGATDVAVDTPSVSTPDGGRPEVSAQREGTDASNLEALKPAEREEAEPDVLAADGHPER